MGQYYVFDAHEIAPDLKIPAIENLGATKVTNWSSDGGFWGLLERGLLILQDLNDTIDFTNNDLRVLGNFPRLIRLQHLLLANNRIHRIEPNLHEHVPNLTTLILTNNSIQELGDLACLANCRRLTYLSLLDNPVTKKKHYRLYLIHKLPKLRVLDFLKIKKAVIVDS